MNKRENIHTATGCKRRPVEIQAKEIPSERVTIMARPVLAAVRTAEFNKWLAERAEKGVHA